MSKADLHIHTNASDGKYSPKEIASMAEMHHVDVIAITDHDTMDACVPAVDAGLKMSIKVIPGIELSTACNGESIHVLGYFKDTRYKTSGLNVFLKDIQQKRIERANKIAWKLKKFFNIDVDMQTIINDSKGVVARPHIAKSIMEAGYDYSWDYIFSNIIGNDCPAYEPTTKMSTKEGVSILKDSGALTVLAHPVFIKKNDVHELMKYDFDGIEAIYYCNFPKDTCKFMQIARTHGKVITAGSDFHGISKEDSKHPSEIGAACLTGNLLAEFLQALNEK